jgi:7-cyano-7-deazaguanine synthase
MLEAALRVHPLYIRSGLAWESTELSHLERYLTSLDHSALQPLEILELPITDLYGGHWSVTGANVPDASTPNQAVFLPGRNVLLLAKAVIWCHMQRIEAVALATIGSNPFPDATPEFFDSYQELLSRALGGRVSILRPYSALSKKRVMQLGQNLPLQWTFSCIRPVNGRHCGRCNKCAERKAAFADAGLVDVTEYDGGQPCTA